MTRSLQGQRGLGVIAAIVVLVILAALAAGMMAFSTGLQVASAQDIQSARAWQAAKAGNEWGLIQVLDSAAGIWRQGGPADPCPAAPGVGAVVSGAPLDLTALTGFRVAVSVQCWRYNEGETAPSVARVVRLYRIEAIACNAVACPAADASGQGYIERRRAVLTFN